MLAIVIKDKGPQYELSVSGHGMSKYGWDVQLTLEIGERDGGREREREERERERER